MLKKILKIIKKNSARSQENFGDFVQKEEREMGKYKSGQENFRYYFSDSLAIFKDYFIPSDANGHKPKILRPRQLLIITILLLTLKIFSVAYLFLVYQDVAKMSETTISQIFSLSNEARRANNVAVLNNNPILKQAAQSKAEDMIINNYFSHTSPDGRMPWNFVNRNSYAYILIGENLALNFLGAEDAQAALMASPGHKKNILNPKYTDLGLAVVSGKINGEETNILVEIFGAKSKVPIKAATATKATTPTKAAAPTKVVASKPIAKQPVKTSVPETKAVIVLATSTETIMSPETSAEEMNYIAPAPSFVDLNVNPQIENAVRVMNVSKIIYFSFLVFLVLALLINIVIRVTVQHKSIIIQTILLILLVLSLWLVDFNFMRELHQAARNIVVF